MAYYHVGVSLSDLDGTMELDRSFGFLIHEVARLFARRFNQHAQRVDLTRAQCRVLGYLARNEGINQAGLAELLEIKPMTLVRQIDRMEEDGWIARRPDPADRRAHRLMLTEKARPILDSIMDLSNAVRAEAFAGLSASEGQLLITLLRRVHSNLAERVSPLPAAEASERAAARKAAALGRASARAKLASEKLAKLAAVAGSRG